MRNFLKKIGISALLTMAFLSLNCVTFADEINNAQTGDSSKTFIFIALGVAIVAIVGAVIYSIIIKNKK